MALDTAPTVRAPLRGLQTLPRPILRVLPPVNWHLEEADIEAVAFMDEAIAAMERIVNAELARDIPSGSVIQEAGRVAHRAALARAEVLRLRGGDEAA